MTKEQEQKQAVEKKFKQLDFVRIKRTSGKFEDDWFIAGINYEEGTAIVLKDQSPEERRKHDGRTLQREITIKELEQWQEQKEGEKIEIKEKELTKKDLERSVEETKGKIDKQHQELVEGEKIVEDKEKTPEEEQKLKEIQDKGKEAKKETEKKIEEIPMATIKEVTEDINQLKREINKINEGVRQGKIKPSEADPIVKAKEDIIDFKETFIKEVLEKLEKKAVEEKVRPHPTIALGERPEEARVVEEKPKEKIEEPVIPKERRAELREFLEKFKESRDKLTLAEKNREKYKGARGLIKKEEKIKAEKEYQEALKEYQEKRAEYIGEKVHRKTLEFSRLADLKAEELNKEKGWATKTYDWYKKLGEINLGKLYKGESKWIRFGLRVLSVRTAISLGLVGLGIGLGAVGAGASAGFGALALRRTFAGLGAGIGSYDMMKMGTESWAKTKGMRREISPEELNKMNLDEISQRMTHFEINTRLTGKKLKGNETYQLLRRAYKKQFESLYGKRTEKDLVGWGQLMIEETLGREVTPEMIAREIEEKVKNNLKTLTDKSDQDLEKVRQKSKRNDRIIKGLAVGMSLFVASGTMEKVMSKLMSKPIKEIKKLLGFKEMPPTVKGAAVEVKPETPTVSPIETAQKGDNLWKILNRQLEKQFGEKFISLDEAEKTFVLSSATKEIAKNPQSFGLENINLVKIGQQFNLGEINKSFPELLKEAGGLTGQLKQTILENNAMSRFLAKLGRSQIDAFSDSQLRDATNFVGEMGYDPSGGKIVKEFGQRLIETQDNFRGASSNVDKFQGFLDEIKNREKGLGGFFRKLFKGSELPQAEGNLKVALINQQEAGQKLANLTGEPTEPLLTGEPVKPFETPSIPKTPSVTEIPPETPAEIKPETGVVAEITLRSGESITTPEGVIGKFFYNPEGNIFEIRYSGKIGGLEGIPTEEVENLFHENWREILSKALQDRGISSESAYLGAAESTAKDITLLKNLLKHLSKGSSEANFVVKRIASLITGIEKHCGDILK